MRLYARVSDEEKRAIEKDMERKGYSRMSDYIRACLIKEKVPVKVQRDTMTRKERIEARVTLREKEKIGKTASSLGMKESTFVRVSCLNKKIVIIPELKEFVKELNKVGVNLNQITRLCNQGLINCPDINNVINLFEEIKQQTKVISVNSQKR